MPPRHRPSSNDRLLKAAFHWDHGDFNAHHGLQMLEEKMVLNRNQWRSDAAYDYLDDLDTEGLAWECLRRNAAYQSEYAARKTGATDSSAVDDLIRQHWGLRFCDESASFPARRNRLLGTGSRYRARHAHAHRIRDRKSNDRTSPA